MTPVEAWIAAMSALCSGVLVKVVDRLYAKTERRFDDAVAIRHELREEVKLLHQEVKALQTELDGWKDRYYELASRYQVLVSECQALRASLEELQHHGDLRAYQQFRRALAEWQAEDAGPADTPQGA